MLRYPIKTYENGEPCVLFTPYRAQYQAGSNNVVLDKNRSIALYMPTNVTIADTMRYDNGQNFLGGAVADVLRGKSDGDITQADVEAFGYGFGSEIAGTVLGLIGSKLGAAGALVSGGAAMGIASEALTEMQKTNQVTLNMRDYSMFKGPTLRTFPFEFSFVPSSKGESDNAMEIIKSFRKTAYPTVNSQIAYNFPEVYKIDFINSPDMIKIPEVALQTITVTYNPNSMSFYKHNGRPVEINISLSFQELTTIHSELVDEGY